MLYRVSAQYQRGGETFIAEFSMREDAILFVAIKHEKDLQLKVKVTYKLYEGVDVIETVNEETGGVVSVGAAASSAQGAGGTFNPTPFNTAPRPASVPHSWLKEDDNKDDRA